MGISGSGGGKGPKLTHRPIVGDGVHTEGELLAWVLQQLTPLREGLGDHLALLDAFGLIVTLPGQPESRRGGRWQVEEQPLPSNLVKDQRTDPSGTLRRRGLLCKEGGLECRAPMCPVLKSFHS